MSETLGIEEKKIGDLISYGISNKGEPVIVRPVPINKTSQNQINSYPSRPTSDENIFRHHTQTIQDPLL